MPDPAELPKYDDRPPPVRLPGGHVIDIPMRGLDVHNQTNPQFYRECADFLAFKRKYKSVRLVVTNAGECPAIGVRLEILVRPDGAVSVIAESKAPHPPSPRESALAASLRSIHPPPGVREPGDVFIRTDDSVTKIEIDCGSLQPGRQVWTDKFFLGIAESGESSLQGQVFADNLPRPQQCALTIDAKVDQTSMTVDDLVSVIDKMLEPE